MLTGTSVLFGNAKAFIFWVKKATARTFTKPQPVRDFGVLKVFFLAIQLVSWQRQYFVGLSNAPKLGIKLINNRAIQVDETASIGNSENPSSRWDLKPRYFVI